MNKYEPITEATFDAKVLNSELPVLVMFGASWSRPCQVVDTTLEELAQDCAGKLKVAKIDADDSIELSLRYDIQSIPTLLFFVGGKLRCHIVGTATKQAILSKLKGAADAFN